LPILELKNVVSYFNFLEESKTHPRTGSRPRFQSMKL
jgi:hypothetical protein